MDNLTLTQYISKYWEIIPKLEGLDDFQKVRGFIGGCIRITKSRYKFNTQKSLRKLLKVLKFLMILWIRRARATPLGKVNLKALMTRVLREDSTPSF